MVQLSRAETVDELKQSVQGRIQALAIGAKFTQIVRQELAPYSSGAEMHRKHLARQFTARTRAEYRWHSGVGHWDLDILWQIEVKEFLRSLS
jgi:hypothetical protein